MYPESFLSRRELLRQSGLGFGGLALAYLLNSDMVPATAGPASATAEPAVDLTAKVGHFAARAKSVIMLVQSGGPSQMDLFDPKPELQKRNGQSANDVRGGDGFTAQTEPLLASSFKFQPRGACGIEFSELVPHLSTVVDDLCVVRSMYTLDPNHPRASQMLCFGNMSADRPAVGAWVSYALGTENQNLPAYVVLRDPAGYPTGSTMLWQNGWLPALYRGTEFSSQGSPVLNLRRARSAPGGAQEIDRRLLEKLNEKHRQRYASESDLEARIKNYELAARMQISAEKDLDISGETEETKKLYGLDNSVAAGYGTRCLLARRLVESGVRFVQIMTPPGNPWDNHSDLKGSLPAICAKTDQPSAALIKDLKRRGLLDETVVLWAGEFGRLPVSQGGSGRDHNMRAFTLLVAGGGFKTGFVYGATDELGYESVVDRVGVPDLMATIFHQLGVHHDKLFYNHHGIAETPTDAKASKARVVAGLLQSASNT